MLSTEEEQSLESSKRVASREMPNRGNQLAFGSFGIKESGYEAGLTARQIEAARIAVTRYMKREGQLWIRIFPDTACY